MVRASQGFLKRPAKDTDPAQSRNKKLRDTMSVEMDEASPVGRRAQERLREKRILRAAIEELALSDYGGMTVDGVAARAGVNKTTVYRKWETKAELIRAALFSVFEMFSVRPTAGDLRSDLLRIAHTIRDFAHSFEGQCLTRLRLLQHPEPELAKIAKDLNAKQLGELGELFNAAVERGEVAPDVDILLLLDMLWGAVHARIVMKSEAVDDALLGRMVDVLLTAAQSGRAKPRTSQAKKRPRRRTR
jgi:AcrR family transcriptional regulator